jgi:DNA-binding NtrC family response regulator
MLACARLGITHSAVSGGFAISDVVPLATLEQRYLAWARARPRLDAATLASRLGVSPRTLYRKLQGLAAG